MWTSRPSPPPTAGPTSGSTPGATPTGLSPHRLRVRRWSRCPCPGEAERLEHGRELPAGLRELLPGVRRGHHPGARVGLHPSVVEHLRAAEGDRPLAGAGRVEPAD